MFSLRALAFFAGGAVIMSGAYALLVSDRGDGDGFSYSADFDDGDRSMHHIVNGDRGDFLLRDDEQTVKARWRGDFELDETGDAIAEFDKELEFEIEAEGLKESVEFNHSGGKIVAEYYRDGEKQTESAETDAALNAATVKFLRISGLKADDRVAAKIKSGGSQSILAEMALLGSDYAKKRYTIALTEQTDLTPDQIIALVGMIDDIESDHDLGVALEAILENEAVTPSTAPALIAAAQGIESDHSLRLLVEAMAGNPLEEEGFNLLLGLYESIESDHDMRVAAEALLESDEMTPEQTARLMGAAAEGIESDHDMRRILVEVAPMFSGDAALASAWLDAFATLDSSHDQRLALMEAADAGDHDENSWASLIEAASMIDSSHDQRLALSAMAEAVEDYPHLADAYRAAAERIDSDYDRRQALEAIGDDTDD